MIRKYRVRKTGDIILLDELKHILTNKTARKSARIPVTDLRHVIDTMLMTGELEEITNDKTDRRGRNDHAW